MFLTVYGYCLFGGKGGGGSKGSVHHLSMQFFSPYSSAQQSKFTKLIFLISWPPTTTILAR